MGHHPQNASKPPIQQTFWKAAHRPRRQYPPSRDQRPGPRTSRSCGAAPRCWRHCCENRPTDLGHMALFLLLVRFRPKTEEPNMETTLLRQAHGFQQPSLKWIASLWFSTQNDSQAGSFACDMCSDLWSIWTQQKGQPRSTGDSHLFPCVVGWQSNLSVAHGENQHLQTDLEDVLVIRMMLRRPEPEIGWRSPKP